MHASGICRAETCCQTLTKNSTSTPTAKWRWLRFTKWTRC